MHVLVQYYAISSSQGVVWGYHVYQVLWEPQVHEKIFAIHKPGNRHDRHTMTRHATTSGFCVGCRIYKLLSSLLQSLQRSHQQMAHVLDLGSLDGDDSLNNAERRWI